jgi:uncharacterized protein YndB with AHSA1/START domain
MDTKSKTSIIAEDNKQELFVLREFDAPREKVFKAFSQTSLMQKFFAPENIIMKFDSPQYASGTLYRYTQTDFAGNLLCAFKGVVHDIREPERIVHTSEMEGLPEEGHVVLEVFQFEKLPNNRTKLTIHDVCRSVSDRNLILESGMEQGLSQIFNNLDVLLKSL